MSVAFIKLSRRNSSLVRIGPNSWPPVKEVVEASPEASEAPAEAQEPVAAEPAPVEEPVVEEPVEAAPEAPSPAPAPAEEPAPAPAPDFSQVHAGSLKAEIVAYADYLGVPSVGTKAEIWAAIEAHLAAQSA